MNTTHRITPDCLPPLPCWVHVIGGDWHWKLDRIGLASCDYFSTLPADQKPEPVGFDAAEAADEMRDKEFSTAPTQAVTSGTTPCPRCGQTQAACDCATPPTTLTAIAESAARELHKHAHFAEIEKDELTAILRRTFGPAWAEFEQDRKNAMGYKLCFPYANIGDMKPALFKDGGYYYYVPEGVAENLKTEVARLETENAALRLDKERLRAIADKWLTQFVETVEGLDPEEKVEVDADRAAIDAAKQ